MDYNDNHQNPEQEWNHQIFIKRGNGFVTASLVCGVFSIFSTIIVPMVFPFTFGGLAILFAVLSRVDEAMIQKAKVGLTCGLMAILINVSLVFVGFYKYNTDLEFRSLLNEGFKTQYGYSFDEMMDVIFDSQTPLNLPGLEDQWQ